MIPGLLRRQAKKPIPSPAPILVERKAASRVVPLPTVPALFR